MMERKTARNRMIADLQAEFPEIEFTNTLREMLLLAWLRGGTWQLERINKKLEQQK